MSYMSYAIVGFGKIGQALAHAFARRNIDVTVASRRPPEALAPQGSGDWTHGRRQVAAGCTGG
jgi:predicted dinucleotide-binding enzyme